MKNKFINPLTKENLKKFDLAAQSKPKLWAYMKLNRREIWTVLE